MYDSSITTPFGYLQGHVPLRIRATASRAMANKYGKTTIGIVYRQDTGLHYSKSRTIDDITALNPNISGQFGDSFTQYEGGRRMAGVFPTAVYLDLALSHEFTIFKVGSKAVTGFFKANIGNVLNHQQILSWDTNYAAASTLTAPWKPASTTFGRPRASADYGTGRTLAVSTGFRF